MLLNRILVSAIYIVAQFLAVCPAFVEGQCDEARQASLDTCPSYRPLGVFEGYRVTRVIVQHAEITTGTWSLMCSGTNISHRLFSIYLAFSSVSTRHLVQFSYLSRTVIRIRKDRGPFNEYITIVFLAFFANVHAMIYVVYIFAHTDVKTVGSALLDKRSDQRYEVCEVGFVSAGVSRLDVT